MTSRSPFLLANNALRSQFVTSKRPFYWRFMFEITNCDLKSKKQVTWERVTC